MLMWRNVLASTTVLVVALLASVPTALASNDHPNSARAASHCGDETIRTATGPTRMRVVLHGRVSCFTAHATLHSYFARVPGQCRGSGCFIELSGGWTCSTSPGEVTRETGEITTCTRRSARVKTYKA
jgi:hypothetical protein